MPHHCRPPPPFTRIIDSGTSHPNLALGDSNPQQYIPYATNAPQVMIPNGANITGHARYNLQLQNVSQQASEADILPSFKHLILSLGKLCDDDCTAIFPNTIAQYTTKTTNQSSQASKITPQDYTNKIFLHTTITPSTRQMSLCQQPTYKNTSNIFTNVLSPQLPEHGSKLLKRATSKHGLVSLSRLSNDTYRNQKQPHLDIWTNKEKTYNQ